MWERVVGTRVDDCGLQDGCVQTLFVCIDTVVLASGEMLLSNEF